MIQRIQSLYLLAAFVLMLLTCVLPLATFLGGIESYDLYAFALRNETGLVVQPARYLGILLALACALPLFIVFCYKRRILQIRLCAAEIVLLAGCLAMLGIYYFLCSRVFSGLAFHAQTMKLPMLFPLLAGLLVWLAARAVFRDELMVRAADRIR